jgi:hypothetical protein
LDLALVDFDGTVTVSDSDMAFLRFAVAAARGGCGHAREPGGGGL